MNKTGNFSKVQRMVILAVLIALTLVMALTPLGYLKIGALSISFLCIPIAIGATVLGPTAGLILGTLFGITSFVQCFGMDAFGTAMLSINWFYTFIICVVARALMGWFTGLIAKGLGNVFEGKTVGKFNLNDLIATILCPVMNTAFLSYVTSHCQRNVFLLFFLQTHLIPHFSNKFLKLQFAFFFGFSVNIFSNSLTIFVPV